MIKRFLASLVVICGLAFAFVSPASAQYGGGVGTGGTMALRQGVPHAQTVYEDQCRRIGAYNHPMCMTGRGQPGYGRGGYGGGRRVVIAAPGIYQDRLIQRFGGSTVVRGGARPVPSPEQIAASVKHKVTRTPVPCIAGYVKNDASGQCDMVSWVPGPDPE